MSKIPDRLSLNITIIYALSLQIDLCFGAYNLELNPSFKSEQIKSVAYLENILDKQHHRNN